MRYRTITDLPTELLEIILLQLPAWKYSHTLRAVSLTCKRLRAGSLEFVFTDTLKVRDITTFDHLLRFLDTNPRAVKRVQSLTLSGRRKELDPQNERYLLETAVDEALLARVVARLPSLQTVMLVTLLYLPSTSEDHRNHARHRHKLRSLSIRGSWTPQCSVAGLFQVLSLFSAKSLDIITWCYSSDSGDSDPFDVRSLQVHRCLAPALLHIDAFPLSGPQWNPQLLAALTKSLRADALRDLRINIDSPKAARCAGELLMHAGRRITHLALHRHAPFSQSERDGWIDPLQGKSVVFGVLCDPHRGVLLTRSLDSWQKLNIESCISLESIYIPIYFGPSKPKHTPQEALASPIARILEHASPTLRWVAIELRDLYRSTAIADESLLKLHELDKVLVQDRFPKLQYVQLEVHADHDLRRKGAYWPECVKAAKRVLPNLQARRLLDVRDTSWTQ